MEPRMNTSLWAAYLYDTTLRDDQLSYLHHLHQAYGVHADLRNDIYLPTYSNQTVVTSTTSTVTSSVRALSHSLPSTISVVSHPFLTAVVPSTISHAGALSSCTGSGPLRPSTVPQPQSTVFGAPHLVDQYRVLRSLLNAPTPSNSPTPHGSASSPIPTISLPHTPVSMSATSPFSVQSNAPFIPMYFFVPPTCYSPMLVNPVGSATSPNGIMSPMGLDGRNSSVVSQDGALSRPTARVPAVSKYETLSRRLQLPNVSQKAAVSLPTSSQSPTIAYQSTVSDVPPIPVHSLMSTTSPSPVLSRRGRVSTVSPISVQANDTASSGNSRSSSLFTPADAWRMAPTPPISEAPPTRDERVVPSSHHVTNPYGPSCAGFHPLDVTMCMQHNGGSGVQPEHKLERLPPVRKRAREDAHPEPDDVPSYPTIRALLSASEPVVAKVRKTGQVVFCKLCSTPMKRAPRSLVEHVIEVHGEPENGSKFHCEVCQFSTNHWHAIAPHRTVCGKKIKINRGREQLAKEINLVKQCFPDSGATVWTISRVAWK